MKTQTGIFITVGTHYQASLNAGISPGISLRFCSKYLTMSLRQISAAAREAKCQIIGFTATPGNNPEKILEVCENLKIKKISVTYPTDYDVQDFISIHSPTIMWINLPDVYKSKLKQLQDFQDILLGEIKERLPDIKVTKYLGKREALAIHQQIVLQTKCVDF